MAGNQRSGPVKVSVVGGGQSGSKIWRREQIQIDMTDPDLDDVAFLSGVYLLNGRHHRCFHLCAIPTKCLMPYEIETFHLINS